MCSMPASERQWLSLGGGHLCGCLARRDRWCRCGHCGAETDRQTPVFVLTAVGWIPELACRHGTINQCPLN